LFLARKNYFENYAWTRDLGLVNSIDLTEKGTQQSGKEFIGRVANRSREVFMPLNTPAHWKVRAQEARVLAEALRGRPEAFAGMLKIANEYEHLAERAEHRAAQRLIDDTAGAK
jgi:hypothetical protein